MIKRTTGCAAPGEGSNQNTGSMLPVERRSVLGAARDPQSFTYWRSCAKPFQVLPFLTSGAFDALGWSEEQLAVSCASHGGEPEHVALVEGMLRDLGLEEGDLACGPHEPSSQRGAKAVRDSGDRPTRVHNNCSGSTAMLPWLTRSDGRRGLRTARATSRGAPAEIFSGRLPCGKRVQAVDGSGSLYR